jgi:hypothetical protein
MTAKPCDNYTMIIVNYANLWLIHSHVARLLDGARLELIELKSHFILLGACTTCPLLRSDLEALVVEIKDLNHKLYHSSRYTVLSPPCEACASLKGKLFHATKEKIKLQQEVAYLTACLEKIVFSEKMIEDDLSQVKESATKSTYRLGVGFERCVDKGEKCAPKFIPALPSTKRKQKSNPPKLTTHPTQSHPSTQREKQGKKLLSRERKFLFACFMAVLVTWLSFTSSVRDLRGGALSMLETQIVMSFFDFPPRSYSRASPHTSSCTFSQFSY